MPLPTPLFWGRIDSHTHPRWEGDKGSLEILGSSRPVFSGLRCRDKGSYSLLGHHQGTKLSPTLSLGIRS